MATTIDIALAAVQADATAIGNILTTLHNSRWRDLPTVEAQFVSGFTKLQQDVSALAAAVSGFENGFKNLWSSAFSSAFGTG